MIPLHEGPVLKFGVGPSGSHLTDANSTGFGYAPPPQGFIPNFRQSILGDPIFQQQQQQIAAQNQAAQGSATSGIGQLLGGYGEIPDLVSAAKQLGLNPNSPMYGLLMHAAQDPNTVASANALTQQGTSTVGQNQFQHTSDINSLMGNLAARGAVTSGDTGVGLQLADRADAQRRQDAQTSLLGHLQDIINTYNGSQQQGISQLQQGAAQAAARQIALNPTVPSNLASTLSNVASSFTPGGGSGINSAA